MSVRLVAGSRRVAIATEDGWFEPAAPSPRAVPEMAARIVKLHASLGEDLQLFLGSMPIAVGGEEHREVVVRLEAQPRTIALDGVLVRVATVRDIELWQYEEHLRAQLAVVDAKGTLTQLPAHELVGPPVEHLSPVGARACAAPKIQSLASTGDAIVALLVECNPEAPIRIATYRWPGPTVTVQRLPSAHSLGFSPAQLVVSRTTRALVGAADGTLVIGRVASDGKFTVRSTLSGVTRVSHAALADDGAIWTLSFASDADHHDAWQVARDGEIVTIADPSGKPLAPSQLAFDELYGIVVIASTAGESWLLVER
jgi:hypothetical protein